MPDELPNPDKVLTREQRAYQIAADVYERRLRGEVVPDGQVLAEHVDILPELFHELASIRKLAEAIAIAKRSGPLTDPIDPLPADALNRPLDLAALAVPIDSEETPRPTVRGLRIAHQIGQGGQATVYLAVHEATGNKAALKVLTGGAWIDSHQRNRFDREARIMATLDHPHIVKVIERGRTDGGAFYIAMEFVSGTSIDEFAADCSKNDPNHPRLLLLAFAKVARALHSAHQAGIIHRDLKPSNIRVDSQLEPRILDFGLAVDLSADVLRLTQSGQWVGSVPWWSPEQVLRGSSAITPQSDIYSLGIVLYQALTAQFPFEMSGVVGDLLNQIVSRSAVPPSRRVPQPWRNARKIDAVVLKAIAKNPIRRYASAEQLADDLDALSDGLQPRWAIISRRKLVAWTTAVALLALAAVAWIIQLTPPTFVPGAELPHFTNSIGMTFVMCRAGMFRTSPAFDPESLGGATGGTISTIPHGFWMAATEVTWAEFKAVTGSTPARRVGAAEPVIGVTYPQAVNFCKALSKKDGRRYRLPTALEWDYASRGGDPRWSLYAASTNAWLAENSGGVPHRVGELPPNDFGLYDMIGNAAEWCQDPSAAGISAGRPATIPFSPLRGGSYLTPRPALLSFTPSHPTAPAATAGIRVLLESTVPSYGK